MAQNSKIEWTDATWNPVVGCSKCSPGCLNCYAEKMAHRLACIELARYKHYKGMNTSNPYHLVVNSDRHWNGKVAMVENALGLPLHWKKPRRIFVCSMGDLFHESVPFEFITRVFDIMCSWRWPTKKAQREGDESELVDPGHTYQVLTKRPERIRPWLDWIAEYWPGDSPFNVALDFNCKIPPHIYMGVTAETQEEANKRIPILLQIPAAKRFVSVEPMLGDVDCRSWLVAGDSIGEKRETRDEARLGWVIAGGENGSNARPMRPDWVRSLRDQCVGANVPFFFKKMGGAWKDSTPTDLEIREFPV